MIDYWLIAALAFALGRWSGRSDLRASRRRPVQMVDRVRLVWSNGKRRA